MKALLIATIERRGPKTHDLSELLDVLAEEERQLANELRSKHARMLATFDPYAIEARYPDVEIADSDAREALGMAAAFVEEVEVRVRVSRSSGAEPPSPGEGE